MTDLQREKLFELAFQNRKDNEDDYIYSSHDALYEASEELNIDIRLGERGYDDIIDDFRITYGIDS